MAEAARNAEPILLHREEDGVVTLTLNRPDQYNALSKAMLEEILSALDGLRENDAAQAVVLDARGKAFCAGHDLREMRSSEDRAFHQGLFDTCSRVMLAINQLPQPVIAKVQGIATAAGCQLVAACDLAVAADTVRFGTSGINLGLFCSTPAVAVSRNVSAKRAMEMLLTGDFVDAPTAAEIGLINRAVPAERLDEEVQSLAERITVKSPMALRLGKQMFYRQLGMVLPDAYAYASGVMTDNMAAGDAREGIDAFLEKREPRWQRR